jgi:hypothetical protein
MSDNPPSFVEWEQLRKHPTILAHHMTTTRDRFRTLWIAMALFLVAFLALAGMVGYLGYRIGDVDGGITGTGDNETLGVCVDTNYESGSVSVGSPVRINGVISCTSGAFTPVAPVDVEAAGGA